MAISSDYAQPVLVNGYSCKNCSDVDLAKKHIDPQHPKSGPFDVDAARDPSRETAVTFGGALAGESDGGRPSSDGAPYRPGQTLDLSA